MSRPSSKSRSVSVEIIPPSSSRPRDLAGVMNAAFDNNDRDSEDELRDDDADAEAEPEDEAPSAPVKAASASLSNKPDAPTPCERCVRTGKACKGAAGVRCDHCKRLKQRCSNSSGPARGKTAAVLKKPDAPSKISVASANNLKRKVPAKGPTPHNGDMDDHSLDGEGSIDEDGEHEPPSRLNKKRRVSKGNSGPSRAQLAKVISEMESSVKRIQTSVAKEVDKMNAIVKTLNAKIAEMDED